MRNDTEQYIPAETAITEAMYAVETLGAHPKLTEAVTALGMAKMKVSEWVEERDKPYPPVIAEEI